MRNYGIDFSDVDVFKDLFINYIYKFWFIRVF